MELNSNQHGSKPIELKLPWLKPFELKSPWLKTNWTQITMAQTITISAQIKMGQTIWAQIPWFKTNWTQITMALTIWAQITVAQTVWAQITMAQNQLSTNHHGSRPVELKNHFSSKSIPLKISSAWHGSAWLRRVRLSLSRLSLSRLVFLSQLVTALLTKTGNTIDTMNDFDYSWIGEGGTSWIRSAHCLENNWDNFARFCPGCTKVPR